MGIDKNYYFPYDKLDELIVFVTAFQTRNKLNRKKYKKYLKKNKIPFTELKNGDIELSKSLESDFEAFRAKVVWHQLEKRARKEFGVIDGRFIKLKSISKYT